MDNINKEKLDEIIGMNDHTMYIYENNIINHPELFGQKLVDETIQYLKNEMSSSDVQKASAAKQVLIDSNIIEDENVKKR